MIRPCSTLPKKTTAKFNTAIQAGANVNYQSLDSYFDESGDDFGRLYSSLHIASLRGCLPIVTRLLELNANCNVINERGGGPLYSASYKGHLRVCELLIQNGAAVNHARSIDGATPLYVAAWEGHGAIVKQLLQHGANVVQARTNDGATP